MAVIGASNAPDIYVITANPKEKASAIVFFQERFSIHFRVSNKVREISVHVNESGVTLDETIIRPGKKETNATETRVPLLDSLICLQSSYAIKTNIHPAIQEIIFAESIK